MSTPSVTQRQRATAATFDPPPPRRPASRIKAPAWTIILFSLPATTGLVTRLWKQGLWFTDFRALVCGAQRIDSGVGLYDAAVPCADPRAAAYVYPPWVARALAGVMDHVGSSAFIAAYVALFVGAVAAMIWTANLRSNTPGEPGARLRFLAFANGGALATGNIAVPVQGAIALAALVFERAPWLLVAVVVLAGWIKPIFLTYLAVAVLARRSWNWRICMAGLGALLGLAPTLAFALFGGPEAAAWRELLGHFVYHVTPGIGLFGWLRTMGLPVDGAVGAALALAWAGGLTLLCAVFADRSELSSTTRVWLGLACGVLANPRLLGEDLFLVGPGVLSAAAATTARSPRLGRLATRAASAACVLSLAGRVLDFADYAAPVCSLILAFILVGCAALVLGRPKHPYLSEGG